MAFRHQFADLGAQIKCAINKKEKQNKYQFSN